MSDCKSGSTTEPPSDDEWECGLPFYRWAECRCPEAYAECDPYTKEGNKAQQQIRQALYTAVKAGEFDLAECPDDVSSPVRPIPRNRVKDVIEEIVFSPVKADGVRINGKWKDIRVFRAGRLTGVPANAAGVAEGAAEAAPEAKAVDASDVAGEMEHFPAYNRVAICWANLDSEIKAGISVRGGKVKAAREIHRLLPNLPLGTVERELRNVLKDKEQTGRK